MRRFNCLKIILQGGGGGGGARYSRFLEDSSSFSVFILTSYKNKSYGSIQLITSVLLYDMFQQLFIIHGLSLDYEI